MLTEAINGAGRVDEDSGSIADAAAAADAYFCGIGAGGSGNTAGSFVPTKTWAPEPGLGGSGAILGRDDGFEVDPLVVSSALALSSVVFFIAFALDGDWD